MESTFLSLSLWSHVIIPLVICRGPLLKECMRTIGPSGPAPILVLGVKPMRIFNLWNRWVILCLHLLTRLPLLTYFKVVPWGQLGVFPSSTDSFYLLLKAITMGTPVLPWVTPAKTVRLLGAFLENSKLLIPHPPISLCTRPPAVPLVSVGTAVMTSRFIPLRIPRFDNMELIYRWYWPLVVEGRNGFFARVRSEDNFNTNNFVIYKRRASSPTTSPPSQSKHYPLHADVISLGA